MHRGLLYGIVSAFLLGSGAVLVKTINSTIPSLLIATYSIIFGFVLVSLHLIKSNFLKKFTKKHIFPFILLGPLGTALALYLVITGFQHTEASVGSFLMQLDLVACIILGVFFLKERIQNNHWIGIILTFLGALALSIDFSNANVKISIFALYVGAGGFLFGVAVVANRLLSDFNPIELAWLRLLGALIVLIPISIYKGYDEFLHYISLLNLQWILYAVSNFYLGYIFLALTSKHLEAWKIGIVLKLVPFFTLILAIIFLKEQIGLKFFIGSLLILSGMFVIDLKGIKEFFNNDKRK